MTDDQVQPPEDSHSILKTLVEQTQTQEDETVQKIKENIVAAKS